MRLNFDTLSVPNVQAKKHMNEQEEPGTASCWWHVRFAGGEVKEVFSPSGNTQTGLLAAYPAAVAVEPFEPIITSPEAPMTAGEAIAIRDWLSSIGERSQEIIDAVLRVCEQGAEARADCLSIAHGKSNGVKK